MSIGVGDEEGVGTLGIEWEAFDEPESAIDRYETKENKQSRWKRGTSKLSKFSDDEAGLAVRRGPPGGVSGARAGGGGAGARRPVGAAAGRRRRRRRLRGERAIAMREEPEGLRQRLVARGGGGDPGGRAGPSAPAAAARASASVAENGISIGDLYSAAGREGQRKAMAEGVEQVPREPSGTDCLGQVRAGTPCPAPGTPCPAPGTPCPAPAPVVVPGGVLGRQGEARAWPRPAPFQQGPASATAGWSFARRQKRAPPFGLAPGTGFPQHPPRGG